MPASLPRKAIALTREFRAAELTVILLRHRIGQMAAHFQEIRAYGAVPELARVCGLAEGTVYRFAQIATIWSEEEFDELIVGRTAPALWSHLVELRRIPSKAQRARLTKVARQRGMSTREVRWRVDLLVGPQRKARSPAAKR